MSSTHPWRGERERDNVSFIGKSSQKIDLKNMILTYTKGFHEKNDSNLPDF
jgi:hypothetical protein